VAPGTFDALTRKLARFAKDNGEAIRDSRPRLPEDLNDREQDSWEPLLAIAELAGVEIAERARQAALEMHGGEDESPGATLLADIREVFGKKEEIKGADLVEALLNLPDRPWCECNHGRPITQNWLARRLNHYKVYPVRIGPECDRARGYKLRSLANAFSHYL